MNVLLFGELEKIAAEVAWGTVNADDMELVDIIE
jgi:hypothetical protein